jgi:3-hydroxybutyryl-CoA dehydratase
MPRYFEEFEPGEVVLSQGRTITEADVMTFAALTGDWNDLHVDEEFARQSKFGRRVAHGALIFSISLGLIQADASRQPRLIAFAGVERLRFVAPVFPGDTITVRRTTQSADPLSENSGFLTALQEVLNQEGVTVLSFTAKFIVRRRPRTGEQPAEASA